MPTQTYRIRGTLTTGLAGADLTSLKAVTYKPLSLNTMQIFGTSAVDAAGHFQLEVAASAGPPSLDLDIMPVPEEIEKFGVLHIEMTAPGLFFPRAHIAPGDWTLIAGVYECAVTIQISNAIWSRWAWLCEEFTVVGQLVKKVGSAYLPVPHAQVGASDVDMPFGSAGSVGGAETDGAGRFSFTFRRENFFVDFANYYPSINRYGTEFWPDLIFNAVQVIGGIKTVIYSEPATAARPQAMWDVQHRFLYVKLVTDKGVATDEVFTPMPAGQNFLFHGIGLIQPHSLTDGYASTGPADGVPNLKDCPFGSTLNVNGQFLTGPGAPKYYQVLFAKWSGAAAPALGDFHPILNESWVVSKFNQVTLSWAPLVIEPISGVVAGEKVYEIPDYTDITTTDKTRLIAWTTNREEAGVRRYPDGKYDLLIKAWDAAGAPVALNPAHPVLNRMSVVVDNTGPKALLKMLGVFDILRTDDMMPYTPVCPVFSKTGNTLPVRFDATDVKGHMLSFTVSFITGHNFYVDQFIKQYDGHSGANERFKASTIHRATLTGIATTTLLPDDIRPAGGFADEIVSWNIGSPDAVRCAYQVRLGVWDRTINGYGYIHYAEDTMHFSLEP